MNQFPTPPPFGDPTVVKTENKRAIFKGIGVGCGGCLALVLVFIGFGLTILAFVMHLLRNSDAAKEGLAMAQKSPALVSLLGEPIEIGWLVTGGTQTNGSRTTADISIPLSGPKGSGRLQVAGERNTPAPWNFRVVTFTPSTGGVERSVDLLHQPTEAPPIAP